MQATTTQPPIPKLSMTEKTMLLRGLINPDYFREKTRPRLYELCGGDPELVHELMLDTMHTAGKASARLIEPFFKRPESLRVNVNGVSLHPFGTSAGMDKNGEGLFVLGSMFGFQEAGTVVLNPRPGNNRIRVATLDAELDLLNAQGFPSKGLEHFAQNIREYRENGGKGVVYVSICGLPLSEENATQMAMKELETIMQTLKPYVDGFVWNPFSPNTAALVKLRTPEIFQETAKLMKEILPDGLRLVKLGPYESADSANTIALVRAFVEGGGHGAITTNTKMIPKEELPESVQATWGYKSAGRSGKFLESYRRRSVRQLRTEFPDIVISAVGGVYDNPIQVFADGATLTQGFTPYAHYGPGLVRKLTVELDTQLRQSGVDTLEQLQRQTTELARSGKLEQIP